MTVLFVPNVVGWTKDNMDIELITASGRAICRNHGCANDEKHIKNGRIIKGSTCACISIYGSSGGVSAYYCRGCIDLIYFRVKGILDSKLWIFK